MVCFIWNELGLRLKQREVASLELYKYKILDTDLKYLQHKYHE